MNFSVLSPMIPTGAELSALLVVVSFSAGLNVYATVGMLGILGRFNVLALPASLHVVQDWKIIAACEVLFLLEFQLLCDNDRTVQKERPMSLR